MWAHFRSIKGTSYVVAKTYSVRVCLLCEKHQLISTRLPLSSVSIQFSSLAHSSFFFSESLKLKGQIRGTRKTHHNTQNPSQRTNSKGNLLVVSLQRHWRSIGNRCQSWWCGALRPLFPHSLFFFGKLMLLGRRSWNRKETRWERYRIARNKTNKKRPASLWKGKTEKKWRFLRKCKKKCHS